MSGCKTIRTIIMLAGVLLFICQAYAAEFSADLILTQPGDTAVAKIYVRDHLYRVENFEGNNKFLAIENRLTDTTTAMDPEEMTYINLEGPSGAFSNPVKGWEYMKRNTVEKYLGVETVNGFECDHHSYAYEGSEEAHLESWKSKKLDHFIKYVVHYGASGDGSIEIRNVVEGPLDDALFKVPDGYTREKTADEIEMERPAVSGKVSSSAPVGRRLVPGGELIVKVDPELSTRVVLSNLIKDTSVCHVHLYKNGQKIELGSLPEPEDEAFVLTYKGDRKKPMFGMQHRADEVRVKLEKGRVMATVFNEYCGDFSTKIVYVRNTGANSLDYEIIGDLDDLGEDDVSVTSGSLASGDVLVAEITRNYYKLKLRVRSTTAGSSTDYVAKINFQV